MVVISGQIVVDIALLSKPQTDKSFGTSSRCRCATATAAAAMSSLLAKIAVGRSGNASRISVAVSPER